jgi:hypothetical protein|tara:strand:+ start:438 stop:800 length:363 start_codon:yes stop_codon:yes gene_type:complete
MASSDNPKQESKELTKKFFDNYYNREISYNAADVDAVIGYFLKRGFDNVAAVNTSSVLLQQADRDQITVFQLIDTLKGVNDVQLSNIVAQILNLNRSKVSTLGYKIPEEKQLFEQRQIIL